MLRKKFLLSVLAIALVCAISVCGTLAYLTDTTDEVRNTFTVGDIFNPDDEDSGISLYEHKPIKGNDGAYTLDPDTTVTSADYDSVLPGDTLPKDPTVEVTELYADAYVFVEVVDETQDTLTFTIDSAWTDLNVKGAHGGKIYAADKVSGSTEGSTWSSSVLSDDTVSISESAQPGSDLGSLSFYGYICQAQGFDTAAAAWSACFAA